MVVKSRFSSTPSTWALPPEDKLGDHFLEVSKYKYFQRSVVYCSVIPGTPYIVNNQHLIPHDGQRYHHGEAIATGFVESTVNQVVSTRFGKK
jgi:hypothetical protein